MSMGLPCDMVVKNPPVNSRERRHTGSTPGLGRYAGRGNSNPLQYSCLENYLDRGYGELQSTGTQRVRHN